MKKIALATALLGSLAVASNASAQSCPPGSWLCAEVQIGTAPPPPPTVYVAPPPQVVYVQPRRVYVQPPPVVVYQPPQPVYVQPPPTYVATGYIAPARRNGYVGIQGQLTGSLLGTNTVAGVGSGLASVGGLGLGLRFRGNGYLGGELALNVVGGTDWNLDSRVEVPVTAAALVYFNPQNRFQIYGVAGLGVSVANVRYNATNRAIRGRSEGDYAYVGGLLGLGAELQLTQRFSLFADVRGFLRGRVDDDRDQNPEFARTNPATGATQTANGSAGVAMQLGGVLYF